ncbi:peptidyl-tRNA hydrolase PTH2-domain-containing protein [Myxozyma melibiosi]|uniref:peptidyl-tRNA hydrolase n=1 Tax=Myxozyma melibiosi TaxID=54550 RepID=A0ABR1FC27_9ASCO
MLPQLSSDSIKYVTAGLAGFVLGAAICSRTLLAPAASAKHRSKRSKRKTVTESEKEEEDEEEDDDDDEEYTDDDSDYDSESAPDNIKDASPFDMFVEHKMILVVRTDLGMTKGKAAAQCCHAALGCYKRASMSIPNTVRIWERSGQPKITVQTKGEDSLLLLQALAESVGITHCLIHDAGRTQIAAGSATVLGLGPAPKNKLDQITGDLKLY